MASYHRIVWFHNRIINNKYPCAKNLSDNFEISTRQAQRDIEYMRDSLNAPIQYNAKRRGYYYTENYTIPNFFLSESERLVLNHLAECYARIGTYGYKEYEERAELLSKISLNETHRKSDFLTEPYIAEIEIIGERYLTTSLDYFKCLHVNENIYRYAFFEPEIFLSVLLSSNIDFKIMKPKWLKERLEQRIKRIITLNC